MQALHPFDLGKRDSWVRWSGIITAPSDEIRAAIRDKRIAERVGFMQAVQRELMERAGLLPPQMIDGWLLDARPSDGQIILLPKPNLVVNSGVQNNLDRWFSIGGPPTQCRSMGVDNGTTNPAADSTSSTSGNGGSDTGSTSRRIVLFDSTPTRSSQTVSAPATYSNANVSFAMKRLFLSKAAAGTTDAAGDLIAMTNVFTIDLTSFTSWSQTFTAQVTGTGS